MNDTMMNKRPRIATGSASSAIQQAIPQTQRRLTLFGLPAEVRNNIYREALITTEVVHSLVPPALLQTNRAIRNDALAMFYAHNEFEITVKRAPEHRSYPTRWRAAGVDKFAWRRFFAMWSDFSHNGSDVLQYITRITLIYELSMTTDFGFGHDVYDGCIGLRFLHGTREEDQDPTYGEPGFDAHVDEDDEDEDDSDSSSSDTDSNASDEEFRELDDEEIMGLDAELADLNGDPGNAVRRILINQPPAPDFADLGVYEIVTAGSFVNWPSRIDTRDLLRDKVSAYGSDNLWRVYPLRRLAKMLRRCAMDCPLAAQNVDFLCDDYQHWMNGDEPYRPFYSDTFYNPDHQEE